MKTLRLASMVRRSLLGLFLLVPSVAAIAVAVTDTWPGLPPGGVTRDAAIRVAQDRTDPGAVALVSAVVQHDVTDPMDGGPVIHQWVWLVTFRGHWHLMCSGSAEACNPTTEWVAINYYTGAWVRSESSYQAG